MCGIAGLVGVDRSLAEARVRHAIRSLAHRGPDGVGWYDGDEAVLGMCRLAIIDLAGGDQPIYNEDRSVAVVCNGELYNYVEELPRLERRGHRLQSRSDVNLVPHLYEELGREAFTPIRGMFAAAIWDEPRHRLTLARDRVGKKPLFYARIREGLAFASEIPALLQLLDRVPGYSTPALADYLRLGFVPHPETVYEDVCPLPPGCRRASHRGAAGPADRDHPAGNRAARRDRNDLAAVRPAVRRFERGPHLLRRQGRERSPQGGAERRWRRRDLRRLPALLGRLGGALARARPRTAETSLDHDRRRAGPHRRATQPARLRRPHAARPGAAG